MSERFEYRYKGIRVDTEDSALAETLRKLVHDQAYRKQFQGDPIATLGSAGIHVPESARARLTLERVDQLIASKREGAGAEALVLPAVGVAVQVDVGTNPATMPVVGVLATL
jgi:hypothetical protein